MKKGFTLVELSIVLVIIGLLIGGILAAQSMIETSQQQSLIRELNQYDIMVRLFKERFSALPGDYIKGNNLGSVNGDGDGQIDEDYRDPGDNMGEALKSWQQLQQAGFLQENFTFTGVGTGLCTTPHLTLCQKIGVNIPPSKTYGNKIGLSLYYEKGTNTTSYYWSRAKAGHVYIIGKVDATGLGRVEDGPFMKPNYLLGIDAKIDNGNIDTGNVVRRANQTTVDGDLVVPVFGASFDDY